MIDLAKARELLKAAVDTQGEDFVYNPITGGSCWYEPLANSLEGDPRGVTGCLVGVALTLAGETRHLGIDEDVASLSSDFPDMLTSAACEYLWEAQRAQDKGASWGEAYRAAEKYAEYL